MRRMLASWKPSQWTGVGLAALLITPSLACVFLDQAVFTWDPAAYAEHALRLHQEFPHARAQWLADLLHLSGRHAPGIEWIGQWFLYLRGLVGSTEHALLLVTILSQAASIALLWATVWILSLGAALPSLMSCMFLAAAPIFVGLSTRFYVEPLQALSVCGFMYTAAAASRWRRPTIATALLFWTAFALLVKVTSPAYCLVPGVLIVWQLVAPRPGALPAASARSRALRWLGLLAAAALLAVTVIWYRLNLSAVAEHVKSASSGDMAIFYGHRAPFIAKLIHWLGEADRCFSRWELWAVLPIAATATYLLGRFRPAPREKPRDLLSVGALFAAAQAALGLTIVSLNVNEDPRFIYAILPCFAVLAGWLGARLPRRVAAAAAALLLVQYLSVHAVAFGLDNASLPWLEPIVTSKQQKDALAAVVRQTATAETNGKVVFITVELRWLNHASYRLEARKRFELTGFMPNIWGFGDAQMDGDRAYAIIEQTHPAAVISYVKLDPTLQQFNRNASLLLERFERSPEFAEGVLQEDPAVRIFLVRAERRLTP